MEKVHTLPNYHSDAVSSINIFYNKNRENWQAWTSSWDKSVCVWVIGRNIYRNILYIDICDRAKVDS